SLECSVAGWIDDTVLRPAHDLTKIVRPRGVAVVTAGERRQRRHRAVHPSEALTYFPSRSTRGKKCPAGECLTQGVVDCGVGDADDQSIVGLHRPGDRAVRARSAEAAQIDDTW